MILVAQGNFSREIAKHLKISEKTVETHRAHIMNKLNLRNLAQLIHFAIREGFITIEVER